MKTCSKVAVFTLFSVLCACDDASNSARMLTATPNTLDTASLMSLLKEPLGVETPVAGSASGPATFVHNNAGIASWRVLALLHLDNGSQLVVNQRFDRFALDKKTVDSIHSRWHYEHVIQLNYTQAVFGDTKALLKDASTSQLARESLALSGTSNQDNSVWLGAYRLTQERSKLTQGSNNGCAEAFRVDSPQLELSLSKITCNPSQGMADVFYKKSYAADVAGKHKPTGQNVNGVAWVEQLWGTQLARNARVVMVDIHPTVLATPTVWYPSMSLEQIRP